MKKLLLFALFSGILLMSVQVQAQEDKSKRQSPPAMASGKSSGGATIKIDYSQPSVKGREIGKNVEPMKGKVWRTGANETTVFEVDKDVMIDGKTLKAGKYGLFSIWNGDSWTVIFSKTWDKWGTEYNEADDVLRVNVKSMKPAQMSEKLTINVKDSKVWLAWGNTGFDFAVK